MVRSWVSQNPPLPVRFLGWESDTATLGRHGWEIAMHEEWHQLHHERRVFVFRHRKAKLVAHGVLHLGFARQHDLMFGSHYDHWRNLPPIELQAIGSEGNVYVENYSAMPALAYRKGMVMCETEPTMYPVERDSVKLSDLSVFAPKGGNPADDLIVDPAQVQELLDKILAVQSPLMRDIRQREARRERTAEPRRQVHAQIVTLQAA